MKLKLLALTLLLATPAHAQGFILNEASSSRGMEQQKRNERAMKRQTHEYRQLQVDVKKYRADVESYNVNLRRQHIAHKGAVAALEAQLKTERNRNAAILRLINEGTR